MLSSGQNRAKNSAAQNVLCELIVVVQGLVSVLLYNIFGVRFTSNVMDNTLDSVFIVGAESV